MRRPRRWPNSARAATCGGRPSPRNCPRRMFSWRPRYVRAISPASCCRSRAASATESMHGAGRHPLLQGTSKRSSMGSMKNLKIDFVSDVSCPWCAIGLASLERALERLDGEVRAELHFQPFELNPSMPPGGQDVTEHLTQKYR